MNMSYEIVILSYTELGEYYSPFTVQLLWYILF